ncbi:hypothetical protein DXG01_008414 [Tephrocybe rancida]|nr:hypothetical protein DXG01_008414 [Tephrocybe rancida]
MDETRIQYLGEMHKVAWMGPKVREALARVAPQIWSGRAANWWDALSTDSAPFSDQEHWLVEKVIIGLEDATVMAAPTTFINASTPYIPIANPNPRPWFIRKGEVVGYLVDPATTCDKPKDEDIFKYVASAEALQTVIEGSLRAQDLVNGIVRDPPSEEDCLLNDENWGPKTTATLEEPLEGDVEDLVTLGPDIPDDV